METFITNLQASPEGLMLLLALGGGSLAAVTAFYKWAQIKVTGNKVAGWAVHAVLFILSNLAVAAAHMVAIIPVLTGTRWAIYVPALMGAAVTLREAQQSKWVQAVLNLLKKLVPTGGTDDAAVASLKDQATQPIMPVITPEGTAASQAPTPQGPFLNM